MLIGVSGVHKDYNVNKLVMKFISSCMIIRDRLLLNIDDLTEN